MTEKKRRKLSRREFLIALGITGGGLLLGTKVGLPFARLKVAELFDSGAAPGGLDVEATAWFQVTSDNIVKLFIPKAEMGQGVHTALAQIAAEELEIEWQQLQVVQAGTGQGLDDNFGTGASNSVSTLYQPLREAAATRPPFKKVFLQEHYKLKTVSSPSSEVVKPSPMGKLPVKPKIGKSQKRLPP